MNSFRMISMLLAASIFVSTAQAQVAMSEMAGEAKTAVTKKMALEQSSLDQIRALLQRFKAELEDARKTRNTGAMAAVGSYAVAILIIRELNRAKFTSNSYIGLASILGTTGVGGIAFAAYGQAEMDILNNDIAMIENELEIRQNQLDRLSN
ncbi:MAG TPA: hypothetical protein PKC28_12575 [Bdellovibrionales bacterium]|nr:hypothetical protein [Bdellovibrionales bacterium]